MNIYNPYTIQDLSNLYIDGFSAIDLDFSYNYSSKIAHHHYENFPVGSILVPEKLRLYFYSIYAFSRLADDIADENFISEPQKKYDTLEQLKQSINNLNKDNLSINNPVLLSLKDTINKFNLPLDPFIKLINAFQQDVFFHQPKNWEEVLNYCDNSANPVGELVLRLFDEYNEKNKILSDKICTGLQLINFWQDFTRDFEIGRCYIPSEILEKYNLSFNEKKLIGDYKNIDAVLNEIYSFTNRIYKEGKPLPSNIITKRLRRELMAIIAGGEKVFDKIQKLENKILLFRPKVTKFEFLIILIKIFI